jgi:molecular chaperone GrpE
MPAPEERPTKVRVMDKRRAPRGEGAGRPVELSPSDPAATTGDRLDESASETRPEGNDPSAESAGAERDLLDDLRRLQAEFDNYRKRVMREQTAMASRASARLVERLLPVLDNLERAIAHGEGGPGVELVHKELRAALEQEGLTEIEAEGGLFDPRVHEAFQAIDEPEATEATVKAVYRRGYRMGERVLRPAMVVVARPPERVGSEEVATTSSESTSEGEREGED